MHGRIRRVWMTALVMSGAIQIDGCSSALQSIGDPRPYDIHPRLPVDPWNMEHVQVGTRLRVRLRDGSRIEGVFGGFDRTPEAAYRARYEAWRPEAPGGAGIPIGATIHWTATGSAPDSGRFAGYDFYSLRVAAADSVTRVLPLRRLDWLQVDGGGPVGADSLTAWCDAGRLPVVTGLRLGTSEGLKHVPLETVGTMRVGGIPAGVALALVAGAVVVVIVVASHEHHPAPRGCDSPSNPDALSELGPALPADEALATNRR